MPFPMFADSTPTWTDTDVIKWGVPLILTVITFTYGIAYGVARFLTKRASNKLRVRLHELEVQAAELPGLRAENAVLRDGRDETRKRLDDAVVKIAESADDLATRDAMVAELRAEAERLRNAVAGHADQIRLDQLRLTKAMAKDGQTWTQRVLSNAPDFKELDGEARRTPIVSVLNLKGGVGKTTVTTNLAAALDAKGYRVLVIDMDLQGSMTRVLLPEEKVRERFDANRLLPDFLNDSFAAEFPNLLDYVEPVFGNERSGLVPTTDYLAYAETNLTIRWLLKDGNRDVRFLLRRELQLKRLTKAYDIILLDCPPVLNISCVNALAASDYLLIPVMPSRQATSRVPVLLHRLREFRGNVNPHLRVLGILANRTFGPELTLEEKSRMAVLRSQCLDVWGEPVTQFDTALPQNKEFRLAEDEHRALNNGDASHQHVLRLATEIEDRLPMFCRPLRANTAPIREVAT